MASAWQRAFVQHSVQDAIGIYLLEQSGRSASQPCEACLRSAGTHVLTTLADAAGYINWNYDVEGLHNPFPERLEKLRKRHGDRLTEH